jgi:hypothetical protein
VLTTRHQSAGYFLTRYRELFGLSHAEKTAEVIAPAK